MTENHRESQTRCGSCAAVLTESPSLRMDLRMPCQRCGSKGRNLAITLVDSITTRDSLGIKRERPGTRRPLLEMKVGADLHRKTGRWMHLYRRVDRESNTYDEVVTDPVSGEIVHECHEPLSVHRSTGRSNPDLP